MLKDADTGEVIAEDGTTIGVASNNVAEYRGLIAGLTMAADLAPDAEIEVRMDSKLVVEQMSGNWKIKHVDMKPLALEANRLAPFGTTYTWVPREQNKHADRLANEALDGKRNGVTVAVREQDVPPTEAADETEQSEPSWIAWAAAGPDDADPGPARRDGAHEREAVLRRARQRQPRAQRRGPRPDPGHRRLAGPAGRAGRRGDRLARTPRPRVREILAERLGVAVEEDPGFAEMEFGAWDGLTFEEVAGSTSARPWRSGSGRSTSGRAAASRW